MGRYFGERVKRRCVKVSLPNSGVGRHVLHCKSSFSSTAKGELLNAQNNPIEKHEPMPNKPQKDPLRRVDRLIEQRRLRKAIPLLRELIESHPDVPRLHTDLAFCLEETGEVEQAITVLREAAERFPDDLAVLIDYAEVLYFNDRFEEAEQVYRRLIAATTDEMKAERSDFYTALGEMLWEQKKKQEAIEAWREALELNPRNVVASENLENANKWWVDHEELIDEITVAIDEAENPVYDLDEELEGAMLRGHYKLVMELAEIVTTKEQVDELEEQFGIDAVGWILQLPFDLAHCGLVRGAAELGKVWARVIERANLLGDRAVILAEGGLMKQAHKQIDEILREFPDDVWVRIKIGDAYRELSEMESAVRTYRDVLAMVGEDYDREGVLERLLPLLRELGRDDEAAAIEREEELRWKQRDEETSQTRFKLSAEQSLAYPNVGRNDLCPCGSRKKYKKCHGKS